MTKELHDTLLFIENRIKNSQSKSVFIPMEEFFWYDERNGQLTSLFEMGYITKPLYYDDGAQIQLTSKGREYLNANNDQFKTKPTVFISYNWGSSELADEIERKIKPYADIKRDKNTIKPWESLVEFMKSIRKQDFAVIIVSDAYLKSSACMYEVLQIMKDDSWLERSMFVLLKDKDESKNAKIYTPLDQLNYVKYWEKKYEELDKALSEHSRATTVPQAEELKKYEYIKSNIAVFTSKVASVLNPDMSKAIDDIISRLIKSSSDINNAHQIKNEKDLAIKQSETNLSDSNIPAPKSSPLLKFNIRKIIVNRQFTEHFTEKYISLIFTLENVGNTQIVLSQYGLTDNIHYNVILIDINKYLVNPESYITLNPKEVKIIEYKYEFNEAVSAMSIQRWKETEVYKLFDKAVFYAQDTTGKMYPEDVRKSLKKEYKE